MVCCLLLVEELPLPIMSSLLGTYPLVSTAFSRDFLDSSGFTGRRFQWYTHTLEIVSFSADISSYVVDQPGIFLDLDDR
jgi:hypothetical protein